MSEGKKARRRFLELETKEVSLVDAGANDRRFAVMKRRDMSTTSSKVPVKKALDGWASLDVFLSPEEMIQVLQSCMGLSKGSMEMVEKAQGRTPVTKAADAAPAPTMDDLYPVLAAVDGLRKAVDAVMQKFPNLQAPISAPVGSGSFPNVISQNGAGQTQTSEAPLSGGAPVENPGPGVVQMLEGIAKSVEVLAPALQGVQKSIEELKSGLSAVKLDPAAVVEPLKEEIAKAQTAVAGVEKAVGEKIAAVETVAKEAIEKASAVRPPPRGDGDAGTVPTAKAAERVTWGNVLGSK